MAIREEYQQLEAEIKKQEERRRKLDLISVGLAKQPDAFDILTAVFHQNGGLELDEVIDFIINSFSEIQEELNDRLNIEDILNHDKYQTLENPLHSIHLSNFQLHLDFIIAVLNHIKEERNSTTNPTGTYDKDMINACINPEDQNRRVFTASHELFHILYKKYILEKNNIDRIVWYDEGMAQYMSGEKDKLHPNAAGHERLANVLLYQTFSMP